VISYTYDEQDQLISETDPISGNTIHYTYDALGNRETKIVKDAAGKVLSTTNYTYNAMNQLTSIDDKSLTYNENGQLTDSREIHYDWDADGHLIQASRKVDGSSIAAYDYDEQGRRVRSIVGDVTTNYTYDGNSNRVLYETNASNQMTCYYTYTAGGQLLSMTRVGGNTYFYHYNAHGDVITVTDTQQNTVATYTYDAWGNILSQSGSFADENPYRYAGYRYDKETGLYYLMARYYNPQNGNFLSLDPDPGDEDDPQTQNGYSYANNNPVMMVDPDGHWAVALAAVWWVPGVGQAVVLVAAVAIIYYSYTYSRNDAVRFSRNKPGPPDPAAKGRAHTRVKRKGGKITGYTTYGKDGKPRKQFRGEEGRTHHDKINKRDVPRPNVKEWRYRKSPDGKKHRYKHVRRPYKREYPK
jgi:RHS repeat-associated protein